MKKALRSVALMLLACVLCVSVLTPAVSAAESVDLKIPVTVQVTGEKPDPAETYVLKLQAGDANAPMPEGTVDGVYTIEVNGPQTTAFVIPTEQIGVYHYTVWQEAGTDARCPYDATVYDVTVYITFAEDGSKETTVLVCKQGESDKCEILFKNHYYPPKSLTVEKKWANDEGLNVRPSSVSVQLLQDGEVVETVKLSSSNNWEYKWEELYGGSEWTVQEIVPAGYINSIKYDGEVVTITNTAALIQTGQLNWPVPVMAVLGLALVLYGLKLLKKERAHE